MRITWHSFWEALALFLCMLGIHSGEWKGNSPFKYRTCDRCGNNETKGLGRE